MGIQFKILLPLLAAFSVFSLLFHLQWIPSQNRFGNEAFRQQQEDVLNALEPDLRRHLLANDLAALYNTLNQQLEQRHGVWRFLKLSNAEGLRLYPLSETAVPNDIVSKVQLEHEIKQGSQKLATVEIVLDRQHHDAIAQQRISFLQWLVYSTLGLMILLILLWQNFFILRPLTRLHQAAKRLAEGQFDIDLPPHSSHDEISELSDAFSRMQQNLSSSDQQLRQALLQAQTGELRQKAIFQNMGEGLISIDSQEHVLNLNEAAEKIFEYSLERRERLKLETLFDTATMEQIRQLIHSLEWQDYQVSTSLQIEGEGIRLNGHRFPVELSLSYHKLDTLSQFHLLVRDITERKTNEQRLLQAMHKAEEASKTKSAFLANMSHEIRTPMNAIIGMTHLALQGESNERQRNYLNKVQRAAETLLHLINDILDFSKIEAGKLSLESLEFSLEDLFDDLANITAIQAQEKGLELILRIDDQAGTLRGDALRLGQILLNLTSNAIKFTDNGEILISAESQRLNGQQTRLKFCVKDSGIGMTDEQQQHLFESFSQADISTTRQYGGTGLGLSICKRLIEMMGGKISVESEVGQGSRFSFYVDVEQHAGTNSNPETPDLSQQHWLVLESSARAADWTRELMLKLGAEVTLSDTAEVWISGQQQNHFDGYVINPELLAAPLKQQKQQLKLLAGQHKPLLLTHQQSQDYWLQRLRDCSIDTCALISKPLIPKHFYRSLGKALGLQPTPQAKQHHASNYESAAAQLPGTRVLVVEDNSFNQELAMELLSSHGLRATLANNGEQALALLQKQEFDGVLMDCQMPVMDGYEAARRIRLNPDWADLPVIAMTANVMREDINKARASGMNDHIAKPIDLRELFIKMAIWFRSPETTTAATDSVTAAVSEKSPDPDQWPALHHLDPHGALKLLENNHVLYFSLLQKFSQHQQPAWQQLQQAAAQTEHVELERQLHTLKGVSGTIGAMRLQRLSAKLETQLSSVGSLKTEDMQAWHDEWQAVMSEIEILLNSRDQPSGQQEPFDISVLVQQLQDQLQNFDVDAAETIDQWLAHCQNREHQQLLKQLQNAMINYDFEAAEQTFVELVSQLH